MLGMVTAAGATKEEVIKTLREAVDDFEREIANNCLAMNFEYDLFPCGFVPMARLLDFEYIQNLDYSEQINEMPND